MFRRLLVVASFLTASLPLAAQPAAPAGAQPAPAAPPVVRQPIAAGPTLPAGSFRVTFDPAVRKEPFSGRVYVVLMFKGPWFEPRLAIDDWFGAQEVLAKDVKDLPPGGSVDLDASSLAYPKPLGELQSGEWALAQAVARCSTDNPRVGHGEGDLYSPHAKISIGHGEKEVLELKLTEVNHETPPKENERLKFIDIVSPSLSKFYGREIHVKAGMALPEGWQDDASKHYPTIYFLPGFGADAGTARGLLRGTPKDAAVRDVIWVAPDPTTPEGHSAFADSDNNGPRAESLMKELIPAIESKFHGAGDGKHRYLMGQAPGAWGAIWLMMHYPDEFASCWAHCPDPVDFRNFNGIDLTAPGVNFYKDEQGNRRPFARAGGQVRILMDDFVRQQMLLGRGNRIESCEAVYGPRGADGRPAPLFDRTTGAVNPETAKAWMKYDIRSILEQMWPTLGPKLAGKLHIYAGDADTFYADGAVRLLQQTLKTLGSDAQVEMVPKLGNTIYRAGIDEMFRGIAKNEGVPEEAKPATGATGDASKGAPPAAPVPTPKPPDKK